MPDVLEDRTPRILRVDGTVELLTKPLSLSAFAEKLGCQAFAVLPLPKLGTRPPYVMVIDAAALEWAVAINDHATRIFAHNREPSLGPIRGHAAVLPDGHFGGFYPQ
jgi:hypothetical protein